MLYALNRLYRYGFYSRYTNDVGTYCRAVTLVNKTYLFRNNI